MSQTKTQLVASPLNLNGADLTFPSTQGSAGQILRNSSTAGTLEFATAGKLLQVKHSRTERLAASPLSISKDTSAATAQYGFVEANRNYGDLNTITITPLSSTSTLILIGNAGYDGYGSKSSRGAHSVVFVKDNTTGYQGGSYPRYDSSNAMQSYPTNDTLVLPIASGNTNSQTWYFKGFSYNESSGSATHTVNVLSTSFVIMEIEA